MSADRHLIAIENIFVDEIDDKSRLVYKIKIGDETKDVWFEVEKQYGKYLCYERSDAIVIGLLSYAMRNHYDIATKVPVTEELLYNINNYLIPSLTKYDEKLYPCKIIAQSECAVKNIGEGVGTGISCGVDSFHAIYKHLNTKYDGFKLTHLCINDVGAFNECYSSEGIDNVKKKRYNTSINVAKEIGLPLIVTDSNFSEAFKQNHLLTHTYSSMFAVFCLQKLWKIYLYGSSGYDFTIFNLRNNSYNDSAFYELLSLNCFRTKNLTVYSEGGALDRLEKTVSVADMPIAQNWLHVCTLKATNCGKCDKCKRTMLALDALGKLSLFSKVFDLDYYYKNKNEYLFWLYKQNKRKDKMNKAVYDMLKDEINWRVKLYPYFKLKGNLLFSIQKDNNKKIIRILGIKMTIKDSKI